MNIAVSSFQIDIPSRFHSAVIVNNEIALARNIGVFSRLHGDITFLGKGSSGYFNVSQIRRQQDFLMGVNSIFLRAVIADVDITFAGCCSNASGPCNNLVVN